MQILSVLLIKETSKTSNQEPKNTQIFYLNPKHLIERWPIKPSSFDLVRTQQPTCVFMIRCQPNVSDLDLDEQMTTDQSSGRMTGSQSH